MNTQVRLWRLMVLVCLALPSGMASRARAAEAPAHVPARPTEPLARELSAEQAARSLDAAALAWQKNNACSQCHANFMYLIARPALAALVPEPPEVRGLYESLVRDRWAKQGLRYPSEAMVVGVPLAFHDRRTTGKLHPLTRQALDRMLTHQRPDGGWNGIGGAARTYISDYEETLLAALGIAVAPDDYARTDAARKALDGVRKYARANPPGVPYQKAMLLWAVRHVEGLIDDAGRARAVDDLFALQRPDGGWALPRLGPDEDTAKFKGGRFATAASDGYGTGFVLFALRQAGVPAEDKRLRRAVAWLKTNQRGSGRWFTPSLNDYTKQNLPSNSGTAFAVLALEACGELAPPKKAGPQWPQFRGPDGQGHASARDLPLRWSETENIAWKSAIPGVGWSSPVLSGEKIWLTTATDEGRSLRALCLDRSTGKVIHDIEVFPRNTPRPVTAPNSHASPTPILEDDRVWVHFGSYGTACLSSEGKVLWTTRLPYRDNYGPSSSPVLYKDLLILSCQGSDVRFTIALDKDTGKERWKQPHKGRNSDSTPLVISTPTGDQLICSLAERVIAYDPATSKELWSAEQGDNYAQVPRPLYGHGLVTIAGGYFSPLVQAIRPDGRGDVTKTHVAWTYKKDVPNNPSPLLAGDELYLVNDTGTATCLDAHTGKQHWRERLGGSFYASPLHADGKIYFLDIDGLTTVIEPGKTFKKLARNKLEGRALASPAAVDQALYLRTERALYRIEKSAR